MTKVVVNKCYGGFSVSQAAAILIGEPLDEYGEGWGYHTGMERHDPRLVAAVEKLGSDQASGSMARLKIEDIEGNQYRISEYDGYENVITPENNKTRLKAGYFWSKF